MPSSKNKFLLTGREVVIFFAIIGVLLLMEFWVFSYRKSGFSQDKLEMMLTTQSVLRDTTDDPCKYPIYGEPDVVEDQYLKLRIECVDGQVSANTMDPRAIKGDSIKAALLEYARVAGFELSFLEEGLISGKPNQQRYRWRCDYNGEAVIDFDQMLSFPSQINCQLSSYE